MHGGAKGSGAPKGERNGMWKHGGHTNEAVALRRAARRLMKEITSGCNLTALWVRENGDGRGMHHRPFEQHLECY